MAGADPVTVNSANDSQIKTSPSKTPIAATSAVDSNIIDGRLGLLATEAAAQGVVPGSSAFSADSGWAGGGRVRVWSATLRCRRCSLQVREETAQFKLSILTVPKARNGQSWAGTSKYSDRFRLTPSDAQVKADSHEKSPFWLWLSCHNVRHSSQS